jgi:hypothetical protein
MTQFDRPFLCFAGIEDPLFGISCHFTLRHEPLNISDNVCEVIDIDWGLGWYNCEAVQLDVGEAFASCSYPCGYPGNSGVG